MKFLLWGAIAFLLMHWLFRGKKKSPKPVAPQPKNEAKHAAAEPMHPCAHCGIHIPDSEAVVAQSGLIFCSEEHRLRHFPG